MGFSIKLKKDCTKTKKFLANAQSKDYFKVLNYYGRKGVAALSSATEIDSGVTANSWGYKVVIGKSKARIEWTNSNLTSQGTPVAILLQYGHGTGTGGYVQGIDYINPALKPIFDDIAIAVWKAVTS